MQSTKKALAAFYWWCGKNVSCIARKTGESKGTIRRNVRDMGLRRGLPRYPRLESLPTVGRAVAKRLQDTGITSVESLSAVKDDNIDLLTDLYGVGESRARTMPLMARAALEYIGNVGEPNWREGNDLQRINGLGHTTIQHLSCDFGIHTANQLAEMSLDEIQEVPHVGLSRAKVLRKSARDRVHNSEIFATLPGVNENLHQFLCGDGYFSLRSVMEADIEELENVMRMSTTVARAAQAHLRCKFEQPGPWDLKPLMQYYLPCRAAIDYLYDIKLRNGHLFIVYDEDKSRYAEELQEHMDSIASIAIENNFEIEEIRLVIGNVTTASCTVEGGDGDMPNEPIDESELADAQADANDGATRQELIESYDLSENTIDTHIDIPHPGSNCSYTDQDVRVLKEGVEEGEDLDDLADSINRDLDGIKWFLDKEGILSREDQAEYQSDGSIDPEKCGACGKEFKSKTALQAHQNFQCDEIDEEEQSKEPSGENAEQRVELEHKPQGPEPEPEDSVSDKQTVHLVLPGEVMAEVRFYGRTMLFLMLVISVILGILIGLELGGAGLDSLIG